MNDRIFDVIVWGASGFTGRLVAEYLAREYGRDGSVKWAMAGRNADKLKSIAADIGVPDIPIVIGDASDETSLLALARQTKVVLTTVGPYQTYGSEMVAACVKAGTDYVDLTGEPPWMRRMIDAHEKEAASTGARIVHSCGFDSIPFDLGVYFVQKLALEKTGKPANEVNGRMLKIKGGMSGGTAASALATVEAARHDELTREVMGDMFALAQDKTAQRPKQPNMRRPHYDADIGKWVAPFIMADINARNVHRTNMLLGYAYGQDFRYSEMMAVPNGPAAFAVTGGLGAFAAGLALAPTRVLMKATVLPSPGEGPTKNQRENGFYTAVFVAKQAGKEIARATVSGDKDPGYGSTSKMIAEAAICLAKDVSQSRTGGGVYTPAAAMGDELLVRLQEHAGLTFEAT